MKNLFNEIFFNRNITKKAWVIKGVETDPSQNDKDDNISIDPTNIRLIISKEKGFKDIVATIQVKDQEYNFVLYDEIIDYINKIREKGEV